MYVALHQAATSYKVYLHSLSFDPLSRLTDPHLSRYFMALPVHNSRAEESPPPLSPQAFREEPIPSPGAQTGT